MSSVNGCSNIGSLIETRVTVYIIDEVRENQVHPAEGRFKCHFVVGYCSCSVPVEHNKAVKIFFDYLTGVNEGLAITSVVRCEVFVEV